MIKFRLSDEAKFIFKKNKKVLFKKQKSRNLNSREFYDSHPDLAPRNQYIYMERLKTKDEVDKMLALAGKKTFLERLCRIKNKLGEIFKKER